MSDIHDRYEDCDPDVVEIKQAIALAPLDLARVAANIMRVADADADADHGGDADAVADADADHGDGVAPNGAAPPSSGSRDLAMMAMFNFDREAERDPLQDGDHQ
jgi:hypothetical protein